MLRRLACRTAGRMPAGFPVTGAASTSMFTLPLLVIALALVGLGAATASALEVVIGGICLVAALSKPSDTRS